MKLVTANSTPLINLAKIGRFELLEALFGTLTIPPAVYNELVIRGHGRPGAEETAEASWITVQTPSETPLLQLLAEILDRGEAEAIALAHELKAELVLLDELHGRRIAQSLGLRVRGTLGLLAEGYRRGLVKDIEADLRLLVAEGTWIAPALMEQILRSLGLR